MVKSYELFVKNKKLRDIFHHSKCLYCPVKHWIQSRRIPMAFVLKTETIPCGVLDNND